MYGTNTEHIDMNINQDLIGKTISGVIATTGQDGSPRELWMLQFSDGTHVEFVSPGARKALRKSAKRPGSRVKPERSQVHQLALNVA